MEKKTFKVVAEHKFGYAEAYYYNTLAEAKAKQVDLLVERSSAWTITI